MKTLRWPLQCIPQIKSAGRFPMPASHSGYPYLHDRPALHQHLYDGTILIGREAFAFRAGDLTLSPPGITTVYDIPRGGTHWCIHFCAPPGAPGGAACRLPLHVPSAGRAGFFGERFREIAETLLPRAGRREDRLAAAAAGAQLQRLLLLMAQHPRPGGERNRRSDRSLEKARQLLERGFGRPLRIGELAATSGLSRNFFARRFRERFGMTAGRFLLHLRMEMAKNLLLSTDRAVKEIAYECGMADPNYFNKQFRRATGVSPSRYRAGG